MNEDLWRKPDDKQPDNQENQSSEATSDREEGLHAGGASQNQTSEEIASSGVSSAGNDEGEGESDISSSNPKKSGKQPTAPEVMQSSTAKETREWRLLDKLVMGLHVEQRRSRRWGIFFKSLTFIYLFVALYLLVPSDVINPSSVNTGPHTALVNVSGLIAEGEEANANDIVYALRNAFKDKNTQGIVMRINSPGGSPVQAGYVYDEIKRLRALYPATKVYAVIGDLGASGGYYIAAAADEIYADKASLVGSIGVISSGFGFVDLMEKIGVERRTITSGENKAFMDPFQPLREEERDFWKSVLKTTHEQFIQQVKLGRGDRLADNPELFTGLIWTGEQAKELGLIDGLGSPGYVAREVIGVENIVNFSPRLSPFEELVERFSITFAKTLSTQLGLGSLIQAR